MTPKNLVPPETLVFQSYQDDGGMIMKGCCNGTPFTIEKILAVGGARNHDL